MALVANTLESMKTSYRPRTARSASGGRVAEVPTDVAEMEGPDMAGDLGEVGGN